MRDRIATGKSDLAIKIEDVVLKHPFNNGYLGRMKEKEKGIYVEWIRYDNYWEGNI
jgi:hypothetical protein